MSGKSLEELSEIVARDIGPEHTIARAEIGRRTAKAQIDAARWMKWSVVAIALTATLTAVGALGAWLWPAPFERWQVAGGAAGAYRLDRETGQIVICNADQNSRDIAATMGYGVAARCEGPTPEQRALLRSFTSHPP